MRFAIALLGTGLFAACAAAQPAAPAWSYPPLTTVAQPTAPLPQVPESVHAPAPCGPIPTGLPERTVLAVECPPPSTGGQQHWVSFNLGILQPFTGRVGVKVWPRENNSVWLEAYGGSVLFDAMYGFGVRVQHTARTFGDRDSLMVSPGIGVHIVPGWTTRENRYRSEPYFGTYTYYDSSINALYYLAGDIDISWLHDFSPHFGFEFGLKLGLAGRLSGRVGDDYPKGLMWGKDLYPILSVYSGFRF
jgi:hypothetical protein